MQGRNAWRTAWLLLLLSGLVAAEARAQDPPIVIDPDAPTADSLRLAAPPADVVDHLLAIYNDSTTTRLLGTFVLPFRSQLSSVVALFRGMLVVGGQITGPVHVINGDLYVTATGRIEGDVLVTGGRIRIDAGGVITGSQRTWADPAPVYRTTAGKLAVRERARTVGELASASRSFYTAGISTTLFLGTGGSYNRVEGLPIVVGPSFAHEATPTVDLRLDLRGIIRTTADPTGLRDRYGYDARMELVFGVPARAVLGGRLRSEMAPIEETPWSRTEAGWLAFLLHEDPRDFYQARGPEIYLEAEPVKGLTFLASVRQDEERSVRATDPISVFRSGDAWRANPVIDDGTYRTARLGLGLDTRNDRVDPTSGWLVRADWEYGVSTDYAPLALPRSIRDPLPESREYHYRRIGFDVRRYARFDPDTRLNLRVVGGGWVGGDPLPMQRRVSLGGGDLLPGYGFRARNCGSDQFVDPAGPALCDRVLSVHAELRRRTGLGFLYRLQKGGLNGLDRIFGFDKADLVIFADAGTAWLAGAGPGKVPTNRIPVLREWAKDVGVGLDTGGLGFYASTALSGEEPLRFTIRLQRRF